MRLAAHRITSSATHFIAPTRQLSHHAFARAGTGASVDGLVERARGGNCRREFSREMTSMARACANGRPSGQKNDFVGRVRARSGRWTSRGRPVRSDPTMDRVASAGTSSGRGARTAWRTLHAISPASQGTHETEDDSGSESEEDEDLKGEYRGAVLVRSNGQKGMATTNRTNNGRIGGSWKRALGDFDKQNGKVGATNGVSDVVSSV